MIKNFFFVAACTVAIELSPAAWCFAQDPTPSSDAATALRSTGPLTPPSNATAVGILWLKPGFRVTQFGVETNELGRTSQQAPPRSDFVAAIQPSIDVGIATKKFHLLATPYTELVRYTKSRTERSANPGVIVRAERRLSSQFALTGQGLLGTTRDRLGFEIDARARRFSQGATIGARFTTERTRLTVNASELESHFDANSEFLGVKLAPQLDRTTRNAGVGIAYRLSSFTSITGDAAVSSDRFRASDRSMDSLRTSGGFEFNPRALISGSIHVGYKATRSLTLTVPPFRGVVANGGLTLKVRDSFGLSAGVDRDSDFSYMPDRPYFIYDLYEASARQALFRRLDVGVGIQSTKMNYRLFGMPGSIAAATRSYDYLVNTSASIGVRVARGGRIGVYVARWERFSSVNPYRSDRIGLFANIGRANANDRGVFVNGPAR